MKCSRCSREARPERKMCVSCAERWCKKSQRYRKANPEKCRQSERKWRDVNQNRYRETLRKWREANPKRNPESADRSVWKKLGVNYTDVLTIRETATACEICGSSEKLVVDHCHETKVLRGRLCRSCNLAIGAFKDDPDLLIQAALYLERSKEATT